MNDPQSEELDEILIPLIESFMTSDYYSIKEDARYIPVKEALLQWRTKSMVALLPKEASTCGKATCSNGTCLWGNAYNAALQDIKRKVSPPTRS